MDKKKLLALLSFLVFAAVVIFVLTAPAEEPSVNAPATPTGTALSEDLTIHFIDVGQADCALIQQGDFTMLIDGGNVDDGQLVVTYLTNNGIEELDYVVCTHAHEDHVGGLPSVLAVFPTDNILSPTRTYSSRCFDDFMYYADQQRLEVRIPSPGDIIEVSDDLDITVLGPVKDYAETNDTSIVLMVRYGQTRFLFTGDMEVTAENDMLDYWEDRYDWNVDVLKSGHHGSSTSSGYRFIYETDPEYVVISVGKDNSYGHPHREVVKLYQDAGLPMFRTDELGTVIATSDGITVTMTWENQNAAPADVQPGEAVTYIGNVNSKKFHTPDCDSLPSEKNQIVFDTYTDAIAAGYEPCGGCLG